MSLRLPFIVCFKYIFLIALVIVNGESSADRISVAKCNEYQTVCPLEASPFNIEGEAAVPKEFPFMALLGYERDNELSWPCAGSLISENFVLTAGHCISSIGRLGRTIQYVRLGDLDFKSENEDAQVRQFNVTESFLHPEYKDRSFYNDIALLKIDRTVDFSDYIRPACLPHQDTEISDRVIVTGWGQTSTSSREQPSTLQKVQLKLVPLGVCNETYSESRRQLQNGLSEETQLCAGSNQGERDTCPGFGGGPLLNTGRKFSCLNEIVGITSFGKGCGSGYPGVYTRIASYVDWIESIVWPVK